MSDVQETTVNPQTLSAKDDAAKTNALIAYGLMVIGLFTGIFWIVGAIWAMVKKADAQGTIFADHYSNITKVFWWGLFLSILGAVLAVFVIGYFIIFAVWIWSIFKIVKGLANLTSNKPYNV
ncbi:YIP1 family protein [Neiella marina]|uniref:YIP1 family protein n=1 Tax=Neiella holothuriorum TaxID=2870530 RepID=A0ABS7EIG7_9GAMM|nr:YIP1 family protein [Neiella holothuriorum]MBW8192115.1 YIP1 family protein [Neiella holothuriorum]